MISSYQNTIVRRSVSETLYSDFRQIDEPFKNTITDFERINADQNDISSIPQERSKNTASLHKYFSSKKLIADSVENQTNKDVRSITPISEWEGYIENIDKEKFTVRLVNIQSTSTVPEDIATFQKDTLSQRERKLLVLGAIVRWVVGIERLPTDQKRYVSELHFRNLPAHSIDDLQRAREKAENLLNSLISDETT